MILIQSALDEQLAEACDQGDLLRVQKLIRQEANPLAFNKMAFNRAALQGHLPVLQFLIETTSTQNHRRIT